MKKFLIFLVAIVVVVCFGLTIFYFVRNDEVINFTTKEIYCNVGDVITRDELGLSVKKGNKKTKYDYNGVAAEDGTALNNIRYDDAQGCYFVSTNAQGGDSKIVITTSNKKFPRFEIVVHIGNGDENSPYYINDAEDLAKIGINGGYDVAKHFLVTSDIALAGSFRPIGANDTPINFTGVFDGNGHSISNLTVADKQNSGLFNALSGATVKNLTLRNVNISKTTVAGALAATVSNSTIERVGVVGGKIEGATVGSLAGEVKNSKVVRAYADGVELTSSSVAGGLVGVLDESTLRATYAITTINPTEGASSLVGLGGLVGDFVISTVNGSIQESYAVASTSKSENVGAFIGRVREVSGIAADANELIYLIGNYCVKPALTSKEISNNTTSKFATLSGEGTNYITAVGSRSELVAVRETGYVFYSFLRRGVEQKVNWDDLAWNFPTETLPTLKMVDSTLPGISVEFTNKSASSSVGTLGGREEENRAALKEALEKNESIELVEGVTYHMDESTAITPINIKDIVINGNGATIDGLVVNGSSLFKSVDNCAINEITFTNLKFTEESNGLFGEVISTNPNTSSSIDGVSVTYADGAINASGDFGGITAKLANNAEIKNCQVKGLEVTCSGENLAGLVAVVESGVLSNSEVEATLAGANKVAGLVAENKGTVSGNSGSVEITANNAERVAGLVAVNNANVSNNNLEISIKITNSTKSGAIVGGLIAENSDIRSLAENNTVTGTGITFDYTNLSNLNTLFVGGIVGLNHGTVNKAYNRTNYVGQFGTEYDNIAGKNFFVGGVAYANEFDGEISQVLVTANVAGNFVAGGVVEMRNGTLDQAYIGTQSDARATITGDKLVAGVTLGTGVADIKRENDSATFSVTGSATISNVQTHSEIIAKADSTISSLVLLFFPNGSTFQNALINNAASGKGKLYTETWTDYNGQANNYNLYGTPEAAGTFTSVAINNTHIDSGMTRVSSFFTWTFGWFNGYHTTYDLYGGVNFFAYVNDDEFNNSTAFSGTYQLVADGDRDKGGNTTGAQLWYTDSFDRTWSFNNGLWSRDGGLTLSFLAE